MVLLLSAGCTLLVAVCVAALALMALLSKKKGPESGPELEQGGESGTGGFSALWRRCCSERRDSVTPGEYYFNTGSWVNPIAELSTHALCFQYFS